MFSARPMSAMERWPSIFVISIHSCGFSVTCSCRFSRASSSGTYSTEGIFLESTRHSSRRRAASIRRFVFDFVMVCRSGSSPGSVAP